MSSLEMRANRARPISPNPSGTLESASGTLSARLGSRKSPEGCLAPGGWDRQGNLGLTTVLAQGDWEVVVVAVGGNCPGNVLMGGSAPASLGTPPVCQPHLLYGDPDHLPRGKEFFPSGPDPATSSGGLPAPDEAWPLGKAQAAAVPLGAWTSVPRWTPGPEKGGQVVAASPNQPCPSQLS